MSTIRLEYDKFSAAPILAELLNDRLLSVGEAGEDSFGDMKSTTFVCMPLSNHRLVVRKLLLQEAAAGRADDDS